MGAINASVCFWWKTDVARRANMRKPCLYGEEKTLAKRQRRAAPRRGDVFELTAPDGRFGYGLVIEGGGVPYIVILGGLHGTRPAIEDLKNDKVALVGWTMDSWFYHGRWEVVGSLEPDHFDVPCPTYLVGVHGEPHASDYKGVVLGPLRPEEQGLLDYMSSRSPVSFHNAFLALHGYREWESAHDKLTVDYARERITRSLANTSRH